MFVLQQFLRCVFLYVCTTSHPLKIEEYVITTYGAGESSSFVPNQHWHQPSLEPAETNYKPGSVLSDNSLYRKPAQIVLQSDEEYDLATAPTLPGTRYSNKDEKHEKYPIDSPYLPSKKEVEEWEKKQKSKQQLYLNKYKEGSNQFRRDSDKEVAEGWKASVVDGQYYNQKINGFQPHKHFHDLFNHNISKTDIGNVNYKLVKKQGTLDYHTLRSTPHGRHLLFVSLLERSEEPLWTPRCHGKLSLYLPDSLKPPNQPAKPSKQAIILRDIINHGRVVGRKELLGKFSGRPINLDEDISRFNITHGDAVLSMLNLAMGQETFDSTLSLLVVLREFVNRRMFIDVVLSVIDMRDDVGFVFPSFMSVRPHDYFQIDSYMKLHQNDSSTEHRHKRQAHGRVGGRNQQRRRQNGNHGRWRISWGDGPFRTLPDSDPESKLWYFREDPMVNSHHLLWHLKNSNRQVPAWHPSHGMNMDRRGEMFYFMHKQMVARYNADRIGLGLGLVRALSSEFWDQPLSPGYDPRLTQTGTDQPIPPRPSGATIPNSGNMYRADRDLRRSIDEGVIMQREGPHRLGYANGIDYGIDALGNAVEAFEPSPVTGNLHNDGHQRIGQMHEGEGLGVMAEPNTAVRDPLFFNWHKHIDDVHMYYKNGLPAYGDEELSFPGVNITAVHVESSRAEKQNELYTFMETTSVRIPSLDLQATDGGSVNVAYDRLNHIPFKYHISVESSHDVHGLLRIFLIPAGVVLPADTDVTQVAIEMDRFLIFLHKGENYFVRESSRSPFITQTPPSLEDLQEALLQGEMSEEEFNWSGCGWPESMVLPRGSEAGMKMRLYVMISQVLPGDSAMTSNWERLQFTSWSWCGVRRNEGDVPDSRPMGFPLDRKPPNGNWQSLMYSGKIKRPNHFSTDVTISHDPNGKTY